MGNPTIFRDDAATTLRKAEVPNADFDGGANNAASNACGIGINAGEGAVVGTKAQFTLLDQHGNVRAGQRSQSIGGYPYNAVSNLPASGGQSGTSPDATIFVAVNSVADDGKVTVAGNATLATLNAGWTAVP